MKLLSLIILTVYAPIELTRYIFLYSANYGFKSEFIGELVIIWLGYIVAMIAVGKLVRAYGKLIDVVRR